ncbi:hypothetical protein Tco_0933616 [Tanacetum coccineum]
MAISVISVSSDSSEESVRTSTRRVILFGTIPTTIPNTTPSVILPTTHIDTTLISNVLPTIPPSLDYTPVSPDYTLASPDYLPAFDTESDPFEDPSSGHIPPLPATLPFLSSIDDSSDSDTPDTPPSPTHGTPFTMTTLSTQSTPVASGALRRRVMILAHGQPIPHGRPYRYHLNGPADSLRDSSSSLSSSSSSETSSDPSLDDQSDSSSDHSLPAPSSGMRPSHHLCSLLLSIPCSSAAIFERPSHDSSFVSPSRKRSRCLAASVLLSSPIPGALSSTRANLLPSPKMVRSSEFAIDLEGCSEDSFEPYVPREAGLSDGIDIDLEIQAEINECIAYADALRVRGIDARVVVEAVDREMIETGARGSVEVRVDRVTYPMIVDDIPEPAQEEGAIEAIESVQRDQGHKIVATGQQSVDMLERIRVLEQDNIRLRDMMDVARALGARDAARNLEPLIGDGGEQGEVNGNEGNRNGGNGGNKNGGANGNGNGNGGGNGYNFEGFMHARECTYQDFLKCQHLSFNGTEGVVGLTRWFEKMETMFHISNCPKKYQVKYATCTLLNSALTWWNSYKRTIGIEAAYAMSWEKLMKP